MPRRHVCLAVLCCTLLFTTIALAQTTLETVKSRGKLVCGVNTGLAGFATVGPDGKWHGFDVDYCRALAAATFNDADKVEFRPLTAQARFTALQAKEIDVLSRNTTWTLSRDTSLGLNFGVTLFYDGQGLMVPTKLQATSAKNLDGATICVQSGTTTELNLADYFRRLQIKFTPVVFETIEHYKRRIEDPSLDVDATSVLVLKQCGPKGYPGMAEVGNMGLPPKLLQQGVTDMVRISDARMSGTAYGTVVLHVSPEAAAGGPLALVRDGDVIELDVDARRLHLDVEDAELAHRRAAWVPPASPVPPGGYASLYIEHVQQAHEGCDFDFLVGCRGTPATRESH